MNNEERVSPREQLANCVWGTDVKALPYRHSHWQDRLTQFVCFVEAFDVYPKTPRFNWKSYALDNHFGQPTIFGMETLNTVNCLPFYADTTLENEWVNRCRFLLCFNGIGGHMAKYWAILEKRFKRPFGFFDLIAHDNVSRKWAMIIINSVNRKPINDSQLIELVNLAPLRRVVWRFGMQQPHVNLGDQTAFQAASPEMKDRIRSVLATWCILTWALDLVTDTSIESERTRFKTQPRWPGLYKALRKAKEDLTRDGIDYSALPVDQIRVNEAQINRYLRAVYILGLDPSTNIRNAIYGKMACTSCLTCYTALAMNIGSLGHAPKSRVDEVIGTYATTNIMSVVSQAIVSRVARLNGSSQRIVNEQFGLEEFIFNWFKVYSI